ncbi:SMI1/KNR4 family protein [Streptomyces sp. NPDC050433]|uniref:SMI1/KNR4 family protein n=1 Tax=Streptomyces sp. NPDC050433 TaxID=3365615 RepID=UPI00379B0D38
MWREIIAPWMETLDIGEPASEDEVQTAEGRIGNFPQSLRELLMEFNGASDEYGTDFIWTAQRIADENVNFRADRDFATLYAPFDSLLFFGDNGGGDQFAFTRSDTVVAWDHETDDRNPVTSSLREYVVNCLESQGGDWHKE